MATLRLFASIREAAGTRQAEFDAATVDELVSQATAHFGTAFGDLVPTCRIWVNGEPAKDRHKITSADEVALLPPVSGG